MSLAVLTGFPGFIGRRLVRKLLADDADLRIAALVEERMLDTAREAAGEIEDGKRIEIFEADIGKKGLGLSPEDTERLRADAETVFHLAAIYSLDVPLELAQRVNVDGTGNVVDFCLEAKKLRRFVYISTAYVAGKRTGTVYEHELVMGQDFKNHYESTKFQAEVWVKDKAVPRVPTTILRPAIVVGDSQTGETQKFDGPYFILRTIAEAERNGRPVPQFGKASAPFNVVPVDFVVNAIAAAAQDEAMEGETLHLVDPEPLNACELVTLLSQEYAGREPKGSIPPKLVETSLRFGPVRERFGGAPRESIVYLNHPVVYDTRRATALLEPHDLRPPNFGDYVGPMTRFFREHEEDAKFRPGG